MKDSRFNIIFFDVATKTGYAASVSSPIDGYKCIPVGDDYVISGTYEVKLDRGENPPMRFRKFYTWADKLIGDIKPKIVGYEQTHFRGGRATELLVGLTTRLQEIADDHNAGCTTIHSSALKKYVTGSGRSDKEEVIKAVRLLYPKIELVDDNHADALAGMTMLFDKYLRRQ